MVDESINDDSIKPTDCNAIVLAAGLSSRMGSENKLTLSVNGKPLLQNLVNAVSNAGINQVIVVLGHEKELIESRIEVDPTIASDPVSKRISFVTNPDYQQGQASSVTCGLKALADNKGPTIICLGDQPLINAKHILTLIDAFKQRGNKQVVIPRVNGQRGNPIMISELVRQRVLSEKHNLGCRRYIDNHDSEILWLDSTEKAYITDLDTPEDVQRFFQSTNSAQHSKDGSQSS